MLLALWDPSFHSLYGSLRFPRARGFLYDVESQGKSLDQRPTEPKEALDRERGVFEGPSQEGHIGLSSRIASSKRFRPRAKSCRADFRSKNEDDGVRIFFPWAAGF